MSKPNVREAALDILLTVETKQAYSNLLLNQKLKQYGLSGKDTGLLTEIVYGTIQRRDTLDFYVAPFLKNPKKLELWVRILLRLSVYQMVYLDRVPDRAVIHEAVEIAKKRGHRGISGMVNGTLRNIQRNGLPELASIEDEAEQLAIATSHPLWLVKRWIRQYGYSETKKMCEQNLEAPAVTIRVNVNKASRDQVIEALQQEGIEAVYGELSEDALQIVKGNPAHSNTFAQGLFTIQDESSMLVGRAVNPNINERVLDSCAAPGGKSTHLAERMQNSGEVISLDLHKHKVKLIKEQADRIGLENIQPMTMDSRQAGQSFPKESFDRILVDAPCSGLGVIRRKPDMKYTKLEKDIERLAEIQTDILEAVAPLLKAGGILVYSTCTIDHHENQNVVRAFLEKHSEYTFDPQLLERMPEKIKSTFPTAIGELQLMPHHFGTDGFYIAALKKNS